MKDEKRYAVLIPHDISEPCSPYEMPAEGETAAELLAMQKAVGGHIEVVSVEALSGREIDMLLVVNEEGKITDPPLPTNLRATEYCKDEKKCRYTTVYRDIIVGNVLLFGGATPDGEMICFSHELARDLSEYFDKLYTPKEVFI